MTEPASNSNHSNSPDSPSEAHVAAEAIVTNSCDGLFALDRDLRVILWNPEMERSTGIPAIDMIGTNILDRFPFLIETGEDQAIFGALEGEICAAPSQRNRLPDTGRDGYYQSTYAPLKDAAGMILGVFCSVHDVTADVETRAALNASGDIVN